MNETRRTPTTGRQSPSLFDKWQGIFYMTSRIDEAGHTKAFDYPVAEHWGGPKCSATTHRLTVKRATNWATPEPSSPNWGIVGKEQPRHEKAIPMGPPPDQYALLFHDKRLIIFHMPRRIWDTCLWLPDHTLWALWGSQSDQFRKDSNPGGAQVESYTLPTVPLGPQYFQYPNIRYCQEWHFLKNCEIYYCLTNPHLKFFSWP